MCDTGSSRNAYDLIQSVFEKEDIVNLVHISFQKTAYLAFFDLIHLPLKEFLGCLVVVEMPGYLFDSAPWMRSH